MEHLTKLLEEVPDWFDQAECVGTAHEIFFPTIEERQGTVREAELISIAKDICRSCSVTAMCLGYALETNQVIGIWGGKTERERKRIRREERRT